MNNLGGNGMEFINLIPNICEGLPFEKGDLVLLNFWGDNEDIELLDLISEGLSKKGVISFRHQCSKRFFENVVLNFVKSKNHISEEYFELLSSFNNVVDIFMYPPSLPKGISEEEIPMFKKNIAELFNALTGNKKYYIQLNIPTEANASRAGIEYEIYRDSLCNALSVDYKELKEACKDKIENLKDAKSIEIFTGEGCTLKLDINGRDWYADDGCGDFPSGEVYIAPVESGSNGDLFIPQITFNGQIYKDVLMSFREGSLVKCSAEPLEKFLFSLPDNHRILCEFGIGLNPRIKELTGHSLFDEKALGTYHIALGMNNLFGGINECQFHMDFVFSSEKVNFK